MSWWKRLLSPKKGIKEGDAPQAEVHPEASPVVYDPPAPVRALGSSNVVLSRLREILHEAPSPRQWARLCVWLDEAEVQGCLDLALEYVQEPLEGWDDLRRFSRAFNATQVVADFDGALRFYRETLRPHFPDAVEMVDGRYSGVSLPGEPIEAP